MSQEKPLKTVYNRLLLRAYEKPGKPQKQAENRAFSYYRDDRIRTCGILLPNHEAYRKKAAWLRHFPGECVTKL